MARPAKIITLCAIAAFAAGGGFIAFHDNLFNRPTAAATRPAPGPAPVTTAKAGTANVPILLRGWSREDAAYRSSEPLDAAG